MQKLNIRVWCQAFYDTDIEVPDGLSIEEAFDYARNHLDEAPITQLTYLEDSDELDEVDIENSNHTWLTDKHGNHITYNDERQRNGSSTYQSVSQLQLDDIVSIDLTALAQHLLLGDKERWLEYCQDNNATIHVQGDYVLRFEVNEDDYNNPYIDLLNVSGGSPSAVLAMDGESIRVLWNKDQHIGLVNIEDGAAFVLNYENASIAFNLS